MRTKLWIIFLIPSFLSIAFVRDCDAECTNNDMVSWNPVMNESAYDTDPQSLNDITARPLGFQYETLEYNDNADPKLPCVIIKGCTDRRLEIMVETTPTAMICVTDVSTEVAQRTTICQESIYRCQRCPTGNGEVTYQFSCQGQSCDQSSVNFWYRFVISEDAEVLDPETWCDLRDSGQYPSSLIDNIRNVPPPATTKATGRAASIHGCLPILWAPLLLLAMLRMC